MFWTSVGPGLGRNTHRTVAARRPSPSEMGHTHSRRFTHTAFAPAKQCSTQARPKGVTLHSRLSAAWAHAHIRAAIPCAHIHARNAVHRHQHHRTHASVSVSVVGFCKSVVAVLQVLARRGAPRPWLWADPMPKSQRPGAAQRPGDERCGSGAAFPNHRPARREPQGVAGDNGVVASQLRRPPATPPAASRPSPAQELRIRCDLPTPTAATRRGASP